jgi:hypothetical protein
MRTEVRRGRKFIEYQDDSLPAGTFVQEIGVHDVSYQDEQGVWQPIDESWETDGQDGFSFRAQRMNHKVRFDSAGVWRWYPRRNVDTEYIVINRPECWLPATNRWGNLLVNGINRKGKDITLTSLRNVTRVIHSRWNGIKTDWILQNANAPTRFRQKIDLVGITEKDGVLYGEDGTQLATLTPTTATDANGAELVCSGSYANGYVDFSVDVTGAVYPVKIDPDFTASTPGYQVYGQNADYATARSTSVGAINWEARRIGQWGSPIAIARLICKFDTSSIGSDSTVTQVNFKGLLTDTPSGNFDIQIVKYDWSAFAADPTNSTKRETTYDGILSGNADDSIWINTSGKSSGTQYTSGNLSTSWINKTGTTYYGLRTSYDEAGTNTSHYTTIGGPSNATSSYRPVLSVTYSTGGALLRVNMNAQMSNYTGGMN